VGVNSPSALRIKSFTNPKVILMSPNVAPNAVRQEKQSATETVATAMEMAAMAIHPDVNYSPQCALIVVKKLKYRSSPARVDQFIAVIATVK